MRVKKRGLSPVIASVLIILLVISLSSIIFTWARGFVAEQTEDTSALNVKLCPAIEFVITNTSVIGSNTLLEIVNRGNVDIDSFDFKISYTNGNSETINLNTGVLSGKVIMETMDFVESGIEEIEAFAVLRSNSKSITCRENSAYLEF